MRGVDRRERLLATWTFALLLAIQASSFHAISAFYGGAK